MAQLGVVEVHAGDGKAWAEKSSPAVQLESDERDMYRMGRKQEFNRNFKVISISSFSLACMMGFVFIPVNAPVLIGLAGTGGAIVMYIANFFGFMTVVVSLAEMSSIAPTAGGQYHWTSEFAPPSWQKYLSYVSGWLSSLSWLVGIASALFLLGNVIPALAALQHPTYEPTAWQAYLLTFGVTVLVFMTNVFLARHLALLEVFVLIFMMIAFFVVIIVLLALSPKLTGSEVFQTFGVDVDSTLALEIVASQAFIFYSLLGSDSTAHMAEETQHANKVIPQAMLGSYIVMGIMNFVLLVVFCFCFVDPEAVFDTKTGYPFLEAFMISTGSASGAIGLTCILVVLILLSATNFMASTSRQIFAFARDNGLPFRNLIARVNSRTSSPINSLVVVLIFVVLISLIGLGSSVAFNAIISLQGMAIAATYEVSLMCLIWRRIWGKPLPSHPWSLGRYGLALNIAGAIYGLYLLIYCAMPGAYPVTPQNLNWAPVIFGAIMLFSQFYYFVWARRVYEGPVMYVRECP